MLPVESLKVVSGDSCLTLQRRLRLERDAPLVRAKPAHVESESLPGMERLLLLQCSRVSSTEVYTALVYNDVFLELS